MLCIMYGIREGGREDVRKRISVYRGSSEGVMYFE